MITKNSQNWSLGSVVRVGFLRLRVLATIPTPGNHRPDEYALQSLDGHSYYRFTPHHGIVRCDDRASALDLNSYS